MLTENAKNELFEHIEGREVELVRIVFGCRHGSQPQKKIEGDLETVLPQLDFDYDCGFGGQNLFGFVWYKDGTWSERGEYDGSEWWKHKKRPPLDVHIEDLS